MMIGDYDHVHIRNIINSEISISKKVIRNLERLSAEDMAKMYQPHGRRPFDYEDCEKVRIKALKKMIDKDYAEKSLAVSKLLQDRLTEHTVASTNPIDPELMSKIMNHVKYNEGYGKARHKRQRTHKRTKRKGKGIKI